MIQLETKYQSLQTVKLGDLRLKSTPSVNPAQFPDEEFELYSVPNFPLGVPEYLKGAEIGSSKKAVEPDTVLFCKINPRINRVWTVPESNGLRQIASTEWIHYSTGDTVIPKYLKYFLSQHSIRDFAAANVSGVGGSLTRARPNVLDNVEIPLPSIDDQKEIVAAIETQFTRLDDAVTALQRSRTRLKRYRASVLKAACEGRLVPTEAELARQEGRSFESPSLLLERIKAEREAAPGKKGGKAKDDVSVVTPHLSELPEGWIWATVSQLNPDDRKCAYGVLQPGPDVDGGVPLVRVGDINNGDIRLNELKHIDPSIAARYPRTKLYGGEVVISLVGAIGRTAVVPDTLAEANVARAVGVIPLIKAVNPHWVEIWFRNPEKVREMDSKSHEVARKTLNLEDVRDATVALPPIAEQHRIVAEVDRRLSIIEQMDAAAAANLKRAESLRQSILRQAFSGRLKFKGANTI